MADEVTMDEAWGAVEWALPEGWRIWSLSWNDDLEQWAALAGQTTNMRPDHFLDIGYGPTPELALYALAHHLTEVRSSR